MEDYIRSMFIEVYNKFINSGKITNGDALFLKIYFSNNEEFLKIVNNL